MSNPSIFGPLGGMSAGSCQILLQAKICGSWMLYQVYLRLGSHTFRDVCLEHTWVPLGTENTVYLIDFDGLLAAGLDVDFVPPGHPKVLGYTQ